MNIHEISMAFTETCQKFHYEPLEEKPLVISRTTPPFFTFSPFQHQIDNFRYANNGKKFVLQHCLRNISFIELSKNPLATQYQQVYSIFNFAYTNMEAIFELVQEFLVIKLHLDKKKIYIMYDEHNHELDLILKKMNFYTIPYDKNRLLCKIPIENEAVYVKIIYHYNGGVIPIVNLVLIDQKKSNAKIDSIFYPERLLFIVNNVATLYCTDMYNYLVTTLSKTWGIDNAGNVCAVLAYLKTILVLYINGIRVHSKKIGYVLKHMEQQLFAFLFQNEITITIDQLTPVLVELLRILETDHVYDFTLSINEYADCIVNNYMHYLKNISSNINHVIKDIKKNNLLTEASISTYYTRYGINKVILKDILKNHFTTMLDTYSTLLLERSMQYPYYFDQNLNTITNPIVWANNRRLMQ